MGAPKTQQVGGGANVGTSNDWNSFLQSMLGQGATGQVGANPAQANAQTGQFQQMIQGMMNQTPSSITQNNPFIQQAQNMPQTPGLQGLNTNIQGSNVAGQLGAMPNANYQAQQVDPALSGGTSQVQAQQFNYGANQIPQLAGINPALMSQGLSNPTNDPNYLATQQYLQHQAAINSANTQAQYSMGGRGMSTGAAYGLAQANAQNAGQNAQTLYNMGNTSQQLDMANRGQNLNANLNNQGQLIQQRAGDNSNILSAGMQNAQLGTQASMANATNMLQNNMFNAGQQNTVGLANAQNSLTANQQNNQFNIQQQANRLQALGMDANSAMQAAIQNNAATQQGNANNLSLFGQQSANQLAQGQLGLGLQNIIGQQQNNAMNNMFSSFQQANNKGSSNASTVQVPNAWQSAISGVGDVLGLAKTATSLFNPLGSIMSPSTPNLGGMNLGLNGSNSLANFNPGGLGVGNP